MYIAVLQKGFCEERTVTGVQNTGNKSRKVWEYEL